LTLKATAGDSVTIAYDVTGSGPGVVHVEIEE
jgi:hypothetical protein